MATHLNPYVWIMEVHFDCITTRTTSGNRSGTRIAFAQCCHQEFSEHSRPSSQKEYFFSEELFIENQQKGSPLYKMTDFLEVLPPSKTDYRNESLATIEITVLVIIFILAIVGNVFILYALIEQKKFRPLSRIYYLIAHLSIADLLVALFNILPQLVWDITFRFKGGDPLCRFIKFMQVFVLYLSTYVLVAMSLDRYIAVIGKRSTWKSSPSLSKILVVLAWFVSIIFSLPQVFIFSYQAVKEDVFDCWATFNGFWNQKTYVTWFVLSAFGFPLLIISICYGAICFKIYSYNYSKLRGRKTDQSRRYQNTVLTTSANNESIFPSAVLGSEPTRIENTQGNCRSSDGSVGIDEGESSVSNLISTAKMKTIKLTTVIIVCFVVCWSPFCVTQLYLTYFPPKSGENRTYYSLLTLFASIQWDLAGNPFLPNTFPILLFLCGPVSVVLSSVPRKELLRGSR